MISPSQTRLAAMKPDGYIQPSGVMRLRDMLSRQDVATAFATWRDQGMTRLVTDVIRDLIMNQPSGLGMDHSDYTVQYGVTQGLEIAYQLIQDPSLLFPGIFAGSTPTNKLSIPTTEFSESSDSVLDS